jgi:hypothetical protein
VGASRSCTWMAMMPKAFKVKEWVKSTWNVSKVTNSGDFELALG